MRVALYLQFVRAGVKRSQKGRIRVVVSAGVQHDVLRCVPVDGEIRQCGFAAWLGPIRSGRRHVELGYHLGAPFHVESESLGCQRVRDDQAHEKHQD